MAKPKKDHWTNNNLQNITQKTKDWATRTPLQSGGEHRCTGRASSPCLTSGTRLVTLVTNLKISHEWGKDREVFTTIGRYPCKLIAVKINVSNKPEPRYDLENRTIYCNTLLLVCPSFYHQQIWEDYIIFVRIAVPLNWRTLS